MITVVAVAHCVGRCEWTAGPGEWAATDRAAEQHTRQAKHPTATMGRPSPSQPKE